MSDCMTRFEKGTLRVSRKERECAQCGHRIRAGERYRRMFSAAAYPGDINLTWDEHESLHACEVLDSVMQGPTR